MQTTSAPTRLILASASPARRRLLQAAGIDPEVIVSGVDESTVSGDARTVAGILARLKAQAVAGQLFDAPTPAGAGQLLDDPTLVLGCDSVLELDGQIHGKPGSAAEATARWRQMRGRSGVLHTGHCLIEVRTDQPTERHAKGVAADRHAEGVAATTVHFAPVTDAEIDAYVASGEPLHVAGAFTLDGLSSPFVERIEGDPSNVIGLSLPLLRRLLGQLDRSVTQLWRTAP